MLQYILSMLHVGVNELQLACTCEWSPPALTAGGASCTSYIERRPRGQKTLLATLPFPSSRQYASAQAERLPRFRSPAQCALAGPAMKEG